MSKDMCVRASIVCVEETPGQAKTMLNLKNFCEKFVTKEQVEELKELLIQKISPGASCQKGKEGDSMEREAERKGTMQRFLSGPYKLKEE